MYSGSGLQGWRWRQESPPTATLHSVTTQKISTWILTVAKTWNLNLIVWSNAGFGSSYYNKPGVSAKKILKSIYRQH